MSTARRFLGSLAAGYTLFLVLAAMEYLSGTLNDSTLSWIALLSTIYSLASLALSEKGYEGVVYALAVPAFMFFICALILSPLSPLLLIGSVERMITEGPSVRNVLALAFSATSFATLVVIVIKVARSLWGRAKG
jgi:hypothetical protein